MKGRAMKYKPIKPTTTPAPRRNQLPADKHKLPPQELITYIVDQVRFFSGHNNFQDDVSMIVMQVGEEE